MRVVGQASGRRKEYHANRIESRGQEEKQGKERKDTHEIRIEEEIGGKKKERRYTKTRLKNELVRSLEKRNG